MNLQFIHIGKCGGVTIRKMLQSQGIPFYTSHVDPWNTSALLESHFESIIPIRNPIERFCSAFYWRKQKVKGKQEKRFKGEMEFLEKHKDVNSLIANLDDLRTTYVHHIDESFNWYLDRYIKVVTPQMLKGLVFVNSIKEDLDNIFNKDFPDLWFNKARKNYKLTKKEKQKLKNYLAQDYKILDCLFNKVGINNNKTKDILK